LPRGLMPAAGRLRVLLDGLMSLSALVTFSWFFVLGPTIIRGSETNVGKVLGVAYPIGDLVLLFCALVILQMNGSVAAGAATRAMGFGMAFVAAADTAFAFQTLNGAYESGRVADIGWSVGYMLVAIGVCAANSPSQAAVALSNPGARPRLTS